MSRLLRTLLVWLCVLSLPVQGMAMRAMRACGAGHGGGAVLVSQAAHPCHESAAAVAPKVPLAMSGQHARHLHHRHMHPTDHQSAHNTVHSAVQSAAQPLDHAQLAAHDHVVSKKPVADKCSACAACCVGFGVGMVSPTWVWPGMQTQAAPLVPHVKAMSASFMPQLPERPPQATLA